MCSRCIGRVLVVELGKVQWGGPSFFAALLTLSWRLLSIPFYGLLVVRERDVSGRTKFVCLTFTDNLLGLTSAFHLWAQIDYQVSILCSSIVLPLRSSGFIVFALKYTENVVEAFVTIVKPQRIAKSPDFKLGS